jgi:hypothetical protein
MNELEKLSFEKVSKLYVKYFSLGFLNTSLENKMACICLTCYITNTLKAKGKNITCYDVLLKIKSDSPQIEKDTFLKSLGAICEDLMYGCDTFPDFGIKPQEMPKTLKKLLDTYVPF